MNLPRVEYEDIISDRGKLNKDLSLKISDKKGTKFLPKDILFGKLRPYLNKWLHPNFNGIAVGDFWVLRSKEVESKFIFYILQTEQFKLISNISSGSKMPRSDWNIVSNSMFSVPLNLTEDKKISLLLSTIENLITLHQRRINIWESLKKEYINVILPSKKHDTLKLWFNGYENIWQNNKINKLANRFDNLRIPVSSSDRVPGETPYYGANGIQDYVEGRTHNGEFILIAEDGANSLRNYPVHYVDGTVWVNNHAHVLQGINGIADNRFLMYTFKSINFAPYLVGGSRFKLNADTMMKINIKVPALNEQKKIGKYFSLIDGYINMSHKKIHQLQKIKKLYLSKMFL